MVGSSFYSCEELQDLGLKRWGRDVLISRKCSLYGAGNISIGDNVRIDDFCILSGNITIGSHVHVSAYTALYGANGITLNDYTGISQRCTLISASDDFSGDYLVGAIHPDECTNVSGGAIVLERFAHVCAHCVIFPNVTISEGCVIGAMSMVRHTTEPWMIYAGIPACQLKKRSDNMRLLVSCETCDISKI